MILLPANLICLLLLPTVGDSDVNALVRAALDQPTQLVVENLPLNDAFDQIVADTGVQISIAQKTLDLLPYGKNTRLNVEVRNVPLRQGLAAMCAPLGLTFEIKGRGVELLPTAQLSSLCRRATFDELETLALLYRTPIDTLLADAESFSDRLQFRIDDPPDPWPVMRTALTRLGDLRADQALTQACDSLSWTWHPAGKQITVLRSIDQQLRHHVSLRQTGRRLIDVLQAIGAAGGVTVRAEPGAIAALPRRTQSNFSIYFENQCLGDAFNLVSATTGLGYRVEPDAVVFFNPTGQHADAGALPLIQPRHRRDAYVGKIILPPGDDGLVIELLIHESDLSPEVNALRKQYLQRADQEIKAALLRLQKPSDP